MVKGHIERKETENSRDAVRQGDVDLCCIAGDRTQIDSRIGQCQDTQRMVQTPRSELVC